MTLEEIETFLTEHDVEMHAFRHRPTNPTANDLWWVDATHRKGGDYKTECRGKGRTFLEAATAAIMALTEGVK